MIHIRISKLIDDKNSNKRFWSYIKSKRNDQCGVPILVKDKKIYTDNLDKANILNEHFSSVFTIDNSPVDNIPPVEGTPFPDISPLHIEADGIKSPNICNLNVQKSHGSDGTGGIFGRFLKETSEHIAPALALIFKASLHQGKFPADWKKPLLSQFLRKAHELIPQTTDPFL